MEFEAVCFVRCQIKELMGFLLLQTLKPELPFTSKIGLILQFIICLTSVTQRWSGLVLEQNYLLARYQLQRLRHGSLFMCITLYCCHSCYIKVGEKNLLNCKWGAGGPLKPFFRHSSWFYSSALLSRGYNLFIFNKTVRKYSSGTWKELGCLVPLSIKQSLEDLLSGSRNSSNKTQMLSYGIIGRKVSIRKITCNFPMPQKKHSCWQCQ